MSCFKGNYGVNYEWHTFCCNLLCTIYWRDCNSEKNHHIYALGLLESLIIVDQLLLLFYFLTKLADAYLHNAIVVMSPIFTLYF